MISIEIGNSYSKIKHMKNYGKEIKILLNKLPHKLQVKYALYCAESVFHLVKDEDKPGVRKSLDTTALWLVDKASADEVYASANYTACAYYAAAYATASAAAATVYAASATSAYFYAATSASAASAAKAKGKDLKHYYEELVRMIKDLTDLDKLIYDID